MAEILERDPLNYAKEKAAFFKELHAFHDSRGTPFHRVPSVNGHEVDLYLLYCLVTQQGGWMEVNFKKEWPEMLKKLGLPDKCINADVALKELYLRYLERWERVHFLGDGASRLDVDDEDSRYRKYSARNAVPHSYNYQQHNISEFARDTSSLATDLYKHSDYDRLALSLLSPLPNEQDFAINVCTLLSNDGRHTLRLEKYPRIVDYLLAHAGLYNNSSLRPLITKYYNDVRRHPINSFWRDCVQVEEFLDLTDEFNFFKQPEEEDLAVLGVPSGTFPVPSTSSASTTQQKTSSQYGELYGDSDSNKNASGSCTSRLGGGFKIRLERDPSDGDLFNLGRNLGTQDYVGQRVLQIAIIMRNLSFIDENVGVLSKNETFLRFLILCSTASWCNLHALGLDMLGNIIGEFIIKDSDRISVCLLKLVADGLHSEDRTYCIASLDALNKLGQNESNEDILSKYLDGPIFKRICSFLTLHDVMLLVYTLECLFALSALGDRPCNFITNIHGVVDTLVSLVTVEGKSYGPKACIGMKLVETVSGNNGVPATTTTTTTQASQLQTAAVATASNGTSVPLGSGPSCTGGSSMVTLSSIPSTSPVGGGLSKSPVPIITARPPTPVLQPQQRIILTPSSTVVTSTSATSPQIQQVITAQQLVQQQHAHQQVIQENEQFALAWLRSTYEPQNNGRVEQQELYRHYLNACAKIGRRGVIAPLHFPRCVRSVFGGSVGPNPAKLTPDIQYYEGIKVRAQPLVISVQSVSNLATAPTPTKGGTRRKGQNVASSPSSIASSCSSSSSVTTTTTCLASIPITSLIPDTTALESALATPPQSPASPILKAQLSAPAKSRESVVVAGGPSLKGDAKSQVMAHPHLSQALLGTGSNLTPMAGPSKEHLPSAGGVGQSNTSLIKSLLATKVNDCMNTIGMKNSTDCQSVVQVAARQQQQKLLAQQTPMTNNNKVTIAVKSAITSEGSSNNNGASKGSRVNGARQLLDDVDSSVSSTTISAITNFNSTKKDISQQQPQHPPPLVPLSNTQNRLAAALKADEDSNNSTGNNSLASSSGGGIHVGISSTEDGDNSLTSFEGLLNGVPNIDGHQLLLNDDSNSKDSSASSGVLSKSRHLKLADLLEKKITEKDAPPLLNGMTPKGLELVENHIEKALSTANNNNANNSTPVAPSVVGDKPDDTANTNKQQGIKRPASDDMAAQEVESKKVCLSADGVGGGGVNGCLGVDSPAPDSVSSSSNGEEPTGTVSTAAAKLFADFAADILEDEEEELMQQQQQQQQQAQAAATIDETAAVTATATAPSMVQVIQNSTGQMFVDQNQSQMIMTTAQPRQIIVSQPANQMVLSTGTQLKAAQTVIVQNTAAQQRPPHVVLQQSNTGQFLLSQGLQGQMQLVTGAAQPNQYVLQTGSTQGTYVVAQSQTAMVHGQPQTVLVAQTPQQQGTSAKTIIILQQPNTAGGQKVMVTPQGQQVVVAQMQRPILHTASSLNSIVPSASVVKTVTSTAIGQTTAGAVTVTMSDKKILEEPKTLKAKIVRDITTPFVCEWGDCQVETKFKSANQVYMHACTVHCPESIDELTCQWDRCDNMKRKRFSMMTHLYDKHCNLESMKQSQLKRKQQSQSGKVESTSPVPVTHPGYAPDAALHAIKRHALEFVNPKELQQRGAAKQGVVAAVSAVLPRSGPAAVEQDDNEGPVTKSMRLTAALILRNLVIYSNNCRRYLRQYEGHLANVALSNVESSRTVAQILYDLSEADPNR